MWGPFSEKKGRLWGIWSSLALGDFQLCVYLPLLISLTLQICLRQAFTDISVCVCTCITCIQERGTQRETGKMTGSVRQSGETGNPTFSWLLKHPRVWICLFLIHQLGGHCPAKTPSPMKVFQQTRRECSKMGLKDPRQPYLWSESPQRLVGRHPAAAGADLRAGKHFEYKRMVRIMGTGPWKESAWAHLETVQEGVEMRVGHVLVELAWKTEGSGLRHALRDTAAN